MARPSQGEEQTFEHSRGISVSGIYPRLVGATFGQISGRERPLYFEENGSELSKN